MRAVRLDGRLLHSAPLWATSGATSGQKRLVPRCQRSDRRPVAFATGPHVTTTRRRCGRKHTHCQVDRSAEAEAWSFELVNGVLEARSDSVSTGHRLRKGRHSLASGSDDLPSRVDLPGGVFQVPCLRARVCCPSFECTRLRFDPVEDERQIARVGLVALHDVLYRLARGQSASSHRTRASLLRRLSSNRATTPVQAL